jgi:hypothetical protein
LKEDQVLTADDLACEGLEWCKDWRDGMFTPAHTHDGWTVEMYGLVDSHEKLAQAYLDLVAIVRDGLKSGWLDVSENAPQTWAHEQWDKLEAAVNHG